MSDPRDTIRSQATVGNVLVTQHAQHEMDEEDITLAEVIEAIASAQVLEDYPDHPRGACCLLFGRSGANRPLHVVCTTARPSLIIITVYEPRPPKWRTPMQRSKT